MLPTIHTRPDFNSIITVGQKIYTIKKLDIFAPKVYNTGINKGTKILWYKYTEY